MKALRTINITAFLLLFFHTDLLAHGGGLDDFGCHHNKKSGGYHCHRGLNTPPPSTSSKAYSPNLITPSSKTTCKVTIGSEYYEFDPKNTTGINLQFSDKSG